MNNAWFDWIWTPKIQRCDHTLNFEPFRTMKKILLSISFAALLFVACRKDTKIDVVAPAVSRVLVNGGDSTVVHAQAGSTLQVTIEVTDNDRLNEVRLVVHDAENGHTHDGSGHAGGEMRLNSGEWGKQDVLQADNTSATIQVEVVIPDSIAGNWHLVVNALDQVGNVSEDYTVLLHVSNDDLPVITGSTMPAADANGTLYVAEGSSFLLSGTVSDPDSLSDIIAYLMTYAGQVGDTTFIEMSGHPTSLSFYDRPFYQAQTGVYRVVIQATDKLGNRRLWDNKVVVE